MKISSTNTNINSKGKCRICCAQNKHIGWIQNKLAIYYMQQRLHKESGTTKEQERFIFDTISKTKKAICKQTPKNKLYTVEYYTNAYNGRLRFDVYEEKPKHFVTKEDRKMGKTSKFTPISISLLDYTNCAQEESRNFISRILKKLPKATNEHK